jgi:hypothetical protein
LKNNKLIKIALLLFMSLLCCFFCIFYNAFSVAFASGVNSGGASAVSTPLFTGTYSVSVNSSSTNAYMPGQAAKSSQFHGNIGVIDQGSDIVIDGYYQSIPIHLVAKVTRRTQDSASCELSFNLANKTLSGEGILTFTKSGDTVSLSGTGEGAYIRPYTPEKGADYHPGSGTVTGSRLSTTLPNNIDTSQGGVGPVGDIPGPDNTTEAATGILGPGLLALGAGLAGGFEGPDDEGDDTDAGDGGGGDAGDGTSGDTGTGDTGSEDTGGDTSGDTGDDTDAAAVAAGVAAAGAGPGAGDTGSDTGGDDTGTGDTGAGPGADDSGGDDTGVDTGAGDTGGDDTGGGDTGAAAIAAGAVATGVDGATEGSATGGEGSEGAGDKGKEPDEEEDDSGEKIFDQATDKLKEESDKDLKKVYEENMGKDETGASDEENIKEGDSGGDKGEHGNEEEKLSADQIKGMTDEAAKNLAAAKDDLKLATDKFNAGVAAGETGADLQKLGNDVRSAQIAEQDATNALNDIESNIKLNTNVNRVIDGVGGFLALKGAYDDFVKNVSKGDDAWTAMTKSFLSNGATGQLSEMSPAVAVMDMVNSVAFGGTEAGKIMSPSENVKNASNYLVDKIDDWVNGTDNATKRIDAGDYGKTIQNFSDASKLGSELLTDDTGKTAQEFTDILTGDDWYKDMHEAVPDLFKTGEDASGLKKVASLIGAESLDSVVSSLEAVKDASGQLGTYFGSHSNTEILIDGLNAAKDAGSTLIDAASHPMETLGNVAGAASDAVQGAINSDFANKLGGAVKQTFKEGVDAAKEDGSTLIDAASHPVETISVVAGMASDTAKEGYNALSKTASIIAKSDTGSTLIDAASHPVETISVVAGMTSDAAKGAFNAASNAASSAASAIKGWFS